MRRHSVLAAIVGTFLVLPLGATNVSVDCTGAPAPFTTITSALNTLDLIGPHTITVAGTCNESVNLRSRNGVTIDGGSPVPGAIHAPAGFVVNVERSHGITLRRLTISGGVRAVNIRAQSEVTIDSTTLESSGTGLMVAEQSAVSIGGNLAVQAVLVHNNASGINVDGSSLTSGGNLTVENNTNNGVIADNARLLFLGQNSPTNGGPNAIRNNGGNGLFATAGSSVDFNGANNLDGNHFSGAIIFENATLECSGAGAFVTSFSNNGRTGAGWLFNASGRLIGSIVQNNGTPSDPLSSGVTSAQNSSVILDSVQISGTNGMGVSVEAGGMVRLNVTTVSNNIAEPVRLRTGSKCELQPGNVLTGTGKNVVTCDGSSLLFGDDAGSVKTDCKK